MSKRSPDPKGNFRDDLLELLERVNEDLLIELGKPVPADKYLPCDRPTRCPAHHNRALLNGDAER